MAAPASGELIDLRLHLIELRQQVRHPILTHAHVHLLRPRTSAAAAAAAAAGRSGRQRRGQLEFEDRMRRLADLHVPSNTIYKRVHIYIYSTIKSVMNNDRNLYIYIYIYQFTSRCVTGLRMEYMPRHACIK